MNEPLTIGLLAKAMLELVEEPVEPRPADDAIRAVRQSGVSVEMTESDLRLSVSDWKTKLRPMAAKLPPLAPTTASLAIPFSVSGAVVSKDGLTVRALAHPSVFSDKILVQFDVIRTKEPAHDLA